MNPTSRLFAKLLTKTAIALMAFAGIAGADTILDQTSMVGLPAVAAPQQFSFTATATESLTVTLTDFQLPAAFSSLQVAVTQADALVGKPATVKGTTATLAIPATAGDIYVIYVIGTPSAAKGIGSVGQGIGSFGVCVTRDSDTTHTCVPAYSFSGNIQTPSAPSTSGVSTLDTNFTATSTGTYQVTLTDMQFPVALQMVSATIFSGATQVGGVFPAGTTPVTLTGGVDYSLLIAAQAAASPQAGLYSARITDPSGTVVFNRTLPVGSLGSATIINNVTARPLTLSLTDYAYPSVLNSLGAAVTAGGVELGDLTAAGSGSAFMAPAGSLEIWQFGVAGASPGVYGLALASDTASVFSVTQVVNPANNASGSYAFAIPISTAGTYSLAVTDLQFPGALASLSSTIAQNGTPLAVDSNGKFTATAGVAVVVVNSTPPQAGSGIFEVAVQSTGNPAKTLFDQTQAVGGGLFNTQVVNYGASGSYEVTLADLGFPSNFDDLALVLSQGGQVLGKIYGGGTFAVNATAGQYLLTFVATPGADNYGLYSVKIASAVAPTLTFTGTPTSVTAGQAVQLTWSSQNATSCTASGDSGWTGSEAVSGSASVSIGSSATLTLACTGQGGSVTKSVSITVKSTGSGGGGGGSIDVELLVLLGAALAMRRGFPSLK
jgi:hypothetical protein